MTHYIAIIHKDADSDYGVSFPDFPGCITAGTSVDDAKDMAKEALEFHIEGMIEDGDDIPAPSSLEAIMNDPDYADGVAFLVEVSQSPKPIRINITTRTDHLAIIDAAAAKAGKSRSAYLIQSALGVADMGAS